MCNAPLSQVKAEGTQQTDQNFTIVASNEDHINHETSCKYFFFNFHLVWIKCQFKSEWVHLFRKNAQAESPQYSLIPACFSNELSQLVPLVNWSPYQKKESEYTCSGRTHQLSHLSISHQLLLKTTHLSAFNQLLLNWKGNLWQKIWVLLLLVKIILAWLISNTLVKKTRLWREIQFW